MNPEPHGEKLPTLQLYFPAAAECSLAIPDHLTLQSVKAALLSRGDCSATDDPEKADAIIIQERNSFKEWRYIDALLAEPLIRRFAYKVFTLNNDDCGTGLLRGLYTSLPRPRMRADVHRAVAFHSTPNELVYAERTDRRAPEFLATWRGNLISNKIRRRLYRRYGNSKSLCLSTTDSWLNHGANEKQQFVDLILAGKFSLCPAGWADSTFRIYESMALGVAPVILADDFVPPAGPDWNELALLVPERRLGELEQILRANESRSARMGQVAAECYRRYFHPRAVSQYYGEHMASCIRQSHAANPRSIDNEVRRWRSLRTFVSNRWTWPQRAMIKIEARLAS